MASGAPEPAALSARRIVSTRMVGATPEVLFQAFANPDRLARWWGPKGFTNTFHEFEILRPERIVFEHVTGPRFQMTVTLAEPQAGKTRVTWRERLTPAIEEDR